ncbi:efflux RND transporter periplasmic adaptor subunit [Chlorobium sp.]|uniref:efflux RND transporter periplasmic adaptor subunit n=2 Tax=Chlorobium sp. TaxID=1095 RepID=UPI0025C1C02D|nr:efflux RND transporter periplasmic adaptor subunit [Chlorobium sp.]
MGMIKPERMKEKKITIAVLLVVLFSGVFWWLQRSGEQVRPVSAYQKLVPVTAVTVREVNVRDSLSVTGTAEAFRDVDVYSETSGLVRKASAEVGDRKRAGDVLFLVDDELQGSSLKKAKIAYEKAALDYRRYHALHEEGAVSVSVFESVRLKREEAETDMIEARKKYRDTRIKAPVFGTVARKLVDEGEMVQPGMKVAGLVDLSRLRVKFFLTEKEVEGIMPGNRLTVLAGNGAALEGRLSTLSDKAGSARTYEAEAVLTNSVTEPLRAGMFVRVILKGRELRHVRVIPRTAIDGTIKSPEVYVVDNGTARLRKVTTGREYGDLLEITDGLVAGEQVVINGRNELRDRISVRVIPQNKRDVAP